jgi:hypothetical protein
MTICGSVTIKYLQLCNELLHDCSTRPFTTVLAGVTP